MGLYLVCKLYIQNLTDFMVSLEIERQGGVYRELKVLPLEKIARHNEPFFHPALLQKTISV